MSMLSQNSTRTSHSSIDGLGFAEKQFGALMSSARFTELGKETSLLIQTRENPKPLIFLGGSVLIDTMKKKCFQN